MPISSITHVLLKIFALNWLLSGAIQLISVIATSQMNAGSYSFLFYAPSLVYFVAGIILWFFAPKFSRILTKKHDGEFNLEGVTLEMLLTTAFVSVGLYFSLDSFAAAFNWVHFFTIYNSPNYGFHQEQGPSYYDLTESLLTFITGAILIFTSQHWSSKLCKKQQSEQVAAPDR